MAICLAGRRSLDFESWRAVDFLKGIFAIWLLVDFVRSEHKFILESIDFTSAMWMNSRWLSDSGAW